MFAFEFGTAGAGDGQINTLSDLCTAGDLGACVSGTATVVGFPSVPTLEWASSENSVPTDVVDVGFCSTLLVGLGAIALAEVRTAGGRIVVTGARAVTEMWRPGDAQGSHVSESASPGSFVVDDVSRAVTGTRDLGGSYPFPTSTMMQLELDQVGSRFCRDCSGIKILG